MDMRDEVHTYAISAAIAVGIALSSFANATFAG
jgi:hypothetical protein